MHDLVRRLRLGPFTSKLLFICTITRYHLACWIWSAFELWDLSRVAPTVSCDSGLLIVHINISTTSHRHEQLPAILKYRRSRHRRRRKNYCSSLVSKIMHPALDFSRSNCPANLPTLAQTRSPEIDPQQSGAAVSPRHQHISSFQVSLLTLVAFFVANCLGEIGGAPPRNYPDHPEDSTSKFSFSKIGETNDRKSYRVITP